MHISTCFVVRLSVLVLRPTGNSHWYFVSQLPAGLVSTANFLSAQLAGQERDSPLQMDMCQYETGRSIRRTPRPQKGMPAPSQVYITASDAPLGAALPVSPSNAGRWQVKMFFVIARIRLGDTPVDICLLCELAECNVFLL